MGPVPAGPSRPEDLVRWIATLEVDHISWDDDSQFGYFWTFPHPGHPLREGAHQIIVERGQTLVVRHGEPGRRPRAGRARGDSRRPSWKQRRC
ncbi:MAG: hypothetical protein R3F60_32320 [bacterium]